MYQAVVGQLARKTLKINIVMLWLIAWAAPWDILYFPYVVGITPIRVVALISFIVVLFQWMKLGKMRISHGELVFFMVAIILTIVSIMRSETFLGQAYFFGLSVMFFILVYLVTAHFSRGRDVSNGDLIDLLVAVGVFLALVGIVDWCYSLVFSHSIWKIIFGYRADAELVTELAFGIPRATGTFVDPNLYAYVLLLPALLLTSRIVTGAKRGSRSTKFGYDLISIVLVVTAIVLSMSRSGIGALLIALVLSVILLKPKFLSIAGLVGLVLVALSAALRWMDAWDLVSVIVEQRVVLYGGAEDIIGLGRYGRLCGGLGAFMSNPLFGVGIGNMSYYLPMDVRHSEVITSHSFFLDILASMGIIGFLFLSIAITLFLRKAWRKARYCPDCKAAIIALLGVFMTQLVYCNMMSPVFAFQIAVVSALCKKKQYQVKHEA